MENIANNTQVAETPNQKPTINLADLLKTMAGKQVDTFALLYKKLDYLDRELTRSHDTLRCLKREREFCSNHETNLQKLVEMYIETVNKITMQISDPTPTSTH